MTLSWDEYFLNLCDAVSSKSKDPSTRVGCVIVGKDKQILSTGWNSIARGVQDLPERYVRPAKNDWVCHAEISAITNAARSGVALNGATLYCSHMCCKNCSTAIVQSGIIEVVIGNGKLTSDYGLEISATIFEEAEVKVRWGLPTTQNT